MRDHMRPMHNQADAKIYESEQRENTKRHSVLEGVSVEKMRKLITKNRLDQRSRHFCDSVY